MERQNQRLSRGHSSRWPLLIILIFCTLVLLLAAYASYARESAYQEQNNQVKKSGLDLSLGESMLNRLEKESVHLAKPVEILATPQAEKEAYQTYVAQYENEQKIIPTSEPTKATIVREEVVAPKALSYEEELALQLKAKRYEALMRALQANSTINTTLSNTSLELKQPNQKSSNNVTETNSSYLNNQQVYKTSALGSLDYRQDLAKAKAELYQLQHNQDSKNLSPLGTNVNSFQPNSSNNLNNAKTLKAYHNLENPDFRLYSEVEEVSSPFLIRQGNVIPCVLLSGINTDLPGMVQAQVVTDVYDSPQGTHLLIPKGSKIIGQYGAAPMLGQRRVMLAFNRLIFPDGKAMYLGAMNGTSNDGYAGFDAEVDNHFWSLLGNAILLGGISAGISISVDDNMRDDNGNLTINGALSQGLGQSLGRVMTQVIERNLAISPTLKVKPGFAFNVAITKDMYFTAPYASY